MPKSIEIVLERKLEDGSFEPFIVSFDPNYGANIKLIKLIKEQFRNG